MNIETLRTRLVELDEHGQTIKAQAEAEKRDLTSDEMKELDDLFQEFDRTERQVEQLERLDRNRQVLAKSQGRLVSPEHEVPDDDEDDPKETPPRREAPRAASRQPARAQPAQEPARVSPVVRDASSRGKFGWHNFGDFLVGVKNARDGHIDPRLDIRNQPTNYANETTGADGGFLVPPDFRNQILMHMLGETSLLARTDQQQTSGNAITYPVDETAPWTTDAAPAATAEGAQKPTGKSTFGTLNISLFKRTIIRPVTDELLEDAPALTAYMNRKVPEQFTYDLNNLIIQGSGTGEMLGFLNSAARVTVAAEGGQAADTILYENVRNMWTRMPATMRNNAVWLMNQDVEPQLMGMTFFVKNVAGTENVGGVPVYMPANGAADAPFGRLMGRPILPTEAAPTLGDEGDLSLVDLSQYLSVQRGGLRQDVSIHLWFDYDVTAFRFVMRIGGRPWASAPITAPGGTTRSAFVTLAARA